RSEGDARERPSDRGRLPDTAACGTEIDRVAAGVVGVESDRGYAARDVAVTLRLDRAWAQRLPGYCEGCRGAIMGTDCVAAQKGSVLRLRILARARGSGAVGGSAPGEKIADTL